MLDAADLTAFFSDFAVPGSYQPYAAGVPSGAPIAVSVIEDSDGTLTQAGRVSSPNEARRVLLRADQVTPRDADRLTFNAETLIVSGKPRYLDEGRDVWVAGVRA